MANIDSAQVSSDPHKLFGVGKDDAKMFRLIFGSNASQILRVAALYTLPEYWAHCPATVESIAMAAPLNVKATFNFMRACTSLTTFTYDVQSKLLRLSLLNTLRKDNPAPLRTLAIVRPQRVTDYHGVTLAKRSGRARGTAVTSVTGDALHV